MKKILVLLLAAVMCFSLVACGGGETPSANDNSGMQQDEQSGGENAGNNTTENTENPYANHSLLEHLYGEWAVYTDYSEPFTTFTINNDGNCVVDGLDATWRIADMYTTDDDLYIEIYNDDKLLGGIMVWGNRNVVQGVGTNYGFTRGYYNKASN